MSGLALAVATWWPMILRSLPDIIKVAHDLYALWCNMRGTRQQNNAVLQAMKLVNKHQDDIDKVLQDPQQKRQLLEGLTILMNRINEHDAGEASGGRNNKAPRCNGSSWKACDVCCSEYNVSNKKPIILICGHTFCRDCLVEILRRGRLLCPTCRTHETRPLDSIPPNRGLMRVLEEEEEGDDSCCGSSDTGGGCDGLPMSYDQQIQYAIFLSQQQAENQGADYVESTWHEVEDAEDLNLAMALQNSEFYEASRLCGLRQQDECVNGAMNPPDKKKGACGDFASITSEEEGEEASLCLALELQQQEMALMQRRCGGGGGGGDDCSNDGAEGWMKEYHTLFGASLCSPVEEDQNLIQGEKKAEDRREEQKDRDEDNGAVCCSGNTDEGRKDGEDDGAVCCSENTDENDGAVCCSGNTDEGRKDGEEECGKKCNEDDCGKEVYNKECLAWLKAEEDLVQMAIRLSLEQHESCTLLAATE